MNASVKTQLLVRRNAEEQNNALYDLTAWEEKIKQNDSKLSEKRNFAPSYQGNEIGNVEKNCKDNTLFINDESLLIPDNISERNGIVFSTPQQPKQFSDISVPSPPCEEVDESAHIHENEKDINIGLEEDERKQGNEMFGKGDYGGAIKRYTKCISLDPSSVLAYSNRGELNYFLILAYLSFFQLYIFSSLFLPSDGILENERLATSRKRFFNGHQVGCTPLQILSTALCCSISSR